jgi:hypothetical protein
MQVIDTGNYSGFTNTRSRDLFRTPYININRNRGMVDAPWYDTSIRSNLSTADYWKRSLPREENYSRMTVPAERDSGWFDADYPGSHELHRNEAVGQAQRLMTVPHHGPWPHGITSALWATLITVPMPSSI